MPLDNDPVTNFDSALWVPVRPPDDDFGALEIIGGGNIAWTSGTTATLRRFVSGMAATNRLFPDFTTKRIKVHATFNPYGGVVTGVDNRSIVGIGLRHTGNKFNFIGTKQGGTYPSRVNNTLQLDDLTVAAPSGAGEVSTDDVKMVGPGTVIFGFKVTVTLEAISLGTYRALAVSEIEFIYNNDPTNLTLTDCPFPTTPTIAYAGMPLVGVDLFVGMFSYGVEESLTWQLTEFQLEEGFAA